MLCLDEIKSKCKVVLVSNSVLGTVEKTVFYNTIAAR